MRKVVIFKQKPKHSKISLQMFTSFFRIGVPDQTKMTAQSHFVVVVNCCNDDNMRTTVLLIFTLAANVKCLFSGEKFSLIAKINVREI